jgi:hypothetical protein
VSSLTKFMRLISLILVLTQATIWTYLIGPHERGGGFFSRAHSASSPCSKTIHSLLFDHSPQKRISNTRNLPENPVEVN